MDADGRENLDVMMNQDPNEVLVTCRNELTKICSKLAEHGEESLLIVANMTEKSCMYVASQIGKKFLSRRMDIMEQFFKLCQDQYSSRTSSSTAKDPKSENRNNETSTNNRIHVKEKYVTSETHHYDASDIGEGNKDDSLKKAKLHEDIFETDQRLDIHHNEDDDDDDDDNEKEEEKDSHVANIKQENSVNTNRRSQRSRTIKVPSWTKSYVVNDMKSLRNRSKKKEDENHKIERMTRSQDDHDYLPLQHFEPENKNSRKRSPKTLRSTRRIHESPKSKRHKHESPKSTGHKQENKSDRIDFTCPNCCKVFSQCRYLSVHMASVHLDKCSICKVCGKMFDSKENLINHKVKHISDGAVKPTNTVEEGEVYTHKVKMETDSSEETTSNELGKDTERTFLEKGVGNVTEKSQVNEEGNENISKSRGEMVNEVRPNLDQELEQKELNINKNDKNNSNLFICEICNSCFLHKKSLKRHFSKHEVKDEAKGVCKCSVCEEEFSNEAEMKKHQKEMHKFDDQITHNLKSAETNDNTCDKGSIGSDTKDGFNGDQELIKNIKEEDILQWDEPIQDELTGKYPCEYCGQLLLTKVSLKVHKRIHTNNVKYPCHHCGKIFKASRYLHFHLKSVHKENKSICRFCGNIYASIYELKKHYYMSHQSKIKRPTHPVNKWYHCNICRKMCLTEMNLQKHKQSHMSGSDITYKCHHCGKIFIKTTYLSEHLRRVHKENSSICRICKQHFPSKGELRRHMVVHNLSNPNTCNVCGKTFENPLEHIEHKKTHSEKPSFVCEFCGKVFKRCFELNVHKRRHSGEKPYKCTVCSSSFASNNVLKAHSLRHQTSRPFQCEICGQAFKGASALAKHIKKHSDNFEKFKCNFCSREFRSAEGQHNHVLSKHAESVDLSKVNFKFRQCEYCDKMFAQKHVYDRHVLVHTGEKPVPCDVCGKGFPNMASLNRHKYTHNPVKRYMCNICNSGTNSKAKLKKHFKSLKHRANCEKIGVKIEDSEEKVTTYQSIELDAGQQKVSFFRVTEMDSGQQKESTCQGSEMNSREQKELTCQGSEMDTGEQNVSPYQSVEVNADQQNITTYRAIDVNSGQQLDIEYHIPDQSGLDLSNMDIETTECVIISLPENVTMSSVGDTDIVYDISTGTAVQSIVNI